MEEWIRGWNSHGCWADDGYRVSISGLVGRQGVGRVDVEREFGVGFS